MKNRLLPFVLIFFVFSQLTLIAQAWEPKGYDIIPPGFEQYEVSSINIVNDSVIWATAMDWSQIGTPLPESQRPLVIKSTDGGETWATFMVEEASGRASWKIHAFDSLKAWISTDGYQDFGKKGLFLTTDGGVNWIEKLHANAGAGAIHFFDELHGVCWYTDAKTTNDGGNSWEPVSNFPSAGSGWTYSISTSFSVIGDTIWSVPVFGKIHRSVDKGHNWTPLLADEPVVIPSIAFADAKCGLLVKEDGHLSRSMNGGENWESLGDWPANILELTRIEGTRILVATSYEYPGSEEFVANQTLFTKDLGEHWIEVDSMVQAYVPEFSLREAGTVQGWIGAFRPNANAPTLHRLEPGIIVSINELLAKSERVNVFPNPVVDQLTVQTDDFIFESVRIFDAQGQTLAVQSVNATTTFSMDLSHLSSGVYFLEIRTEGGFIIKKVVKR